MKFLTEQDVKRVYEASPFNSYKTQKDTRLTPGARQYLNDRKVKLVEEIARTDAPIRDSLKREICCPTANPAHNPFPPECNWRLKIAVENMTIVAGMFRRAQTCFESSGGLEARKVRALRESFDEVACRVEKSTLGMPKCSCASCATRRCQTAEEERYISCSHICGQGTVCLRELNIALCALKTIIALALTDQTNGVSSAKIIESLDEIRRKILCLTESMEISDGQ